jgi:hypothetical protein
MTEHMRSSRPRSPVRHRWLTQDDLTGELACADCNVTIGTFENAFNRLYDVAITIAEQGADEGDREDAMDAVSEADYVGAARCR